MKPNPIKSGLYAALWAFLASFAPAVLRFTAEVYEWADGQGVSEFPHVSVLGYAAVAALTATVAGVVAAAVRWLQANTSFPGTPPSYPAPPPAG